MSRVISGGYEEVAIDTLVPHPDNPRQGDVGAVADSIEANGFFGALIVQRSSRHILAGNHRWEAARGIGYKTIPVLWADVDDDRARRILLADNRTNDLSTYDDDALVRLLVELAEGDGGLEGTGFDGDALDELIADVGGDDDFSLPDNDEPEFGTVSFQLTKEQKAELERAVDIALALSPVPDGENRNAHALSVIVETFITTTGDGG